MEDVGEECFEKELPRGQPFDDTHRCPAAGARPRRPWCGRCERFVQTPQCRGMGPLVMASWRISGVNRGAEARRTLAHSDSAVTPLYTAQKTPPACRHLRRLKPCPFLRTLWKHPSSAAFEPRPVESVAFQPRSPGRLPPAGAAQARRQASHSALFSCRHTRGDGCLRLSTSRAHSTC